MISDNYMSSDWYPTMKCALRITAFYICALFSIIVMAGSSSPLFPGIKYDSAIFSVMGEGWKNGFIPYRDLFDNKGPVIYLLHIIISWFGPGKTGLVIMEALFYTISMELIYRMGNIFKLTVTGKLLATAASFVCYALFIDWGDSVEMWSLPFALLALLVGLNMITKTEKSNFISNSKERLRRFMQGSFIIGFCFGIISMIRLNNNCIICGLIIGICVQIFSGHSEFKEKLKIFGQSALWCIIGVFIAVLPFFIYFAVNGAFSDFLFANFKYNLSYKANWYSKSAIENFYFLWICILLPVSALLYDKRNRSAFFFSSLFIAVCTFLTFITGAGYLHYFMMLVPLFAMTVQMALNLCKGKKMFRLTGNLTIALLIIFLLTNYKVAYSRGIMAFSAMKSWNNWEEQITNQSSFIRNFTSIKSYILSKIPESERGSIYVFDSAETVSALTDMGITPIGKYFYLQPDVVRVTPEMPEKIHAAFINAKPAWIISGNKIEEEPLISSQSSEYVLTDNFNSVYIYKRK